MTAEDPSRSSKEVIMNNPAQYGVTFATPLSGAERTAQLADAVAKQAERLTEKASSVLANVLLPAPTTNRVTPSQEEPVSPLFGGLWKSLRLIEQSLADIDEILQRVDS